MLLLLLLLEKKEERFHSSSSGRHHRLSRKKKAPRHKTNEMGTFILFYFQLDDEKTANHRHPRGIAALMQQDNVARSVCVCVCKIAIRAACYEKKKPQKNWLVVHV